MSRRRRKRSWARQRPDISRLQSPTSWRYSLSLRRMIAINKSRTDERSLSEFHVVDLEFGFGRKLSRRLGSSDLSTLCCLISGKSKLESRSKYLMPRIDKPIMKIREAELTYVDRKLRRDFLYHKSGHSFLTRRQISYVITEEANLYRVGSKDG